MYIVRKGVAVGGKRLDACYMGYIWDMCTMAFVDRPDSWDTLKDGLEAFYGERTDRRGLSLSLFA